MIHAPSTFCKTRTGKIILGQWPENRSWLGKTRQAMHKDVTPPLQHQMWVPVLPDCGGVESKPGPEPQEVKHGAPQAQASPLPHELVMGLSVTGLQAINTKCKGM